MSEPVEYSRRGRLVADLERLWRHDPERRFGQMLMQALTSSLDLLAAGSSIASTSDSQLRLAIDERWAEESKRNYRVVPGPYWDTESKWQRSFLNGLPRDPARIEPFVGALIQVSERHVDLQLCDLISRAVEGAQGLWVIEDGELRRALVS